VTLTAAERSEAADRLWEAERHQRPVAPLSESFPGLDVEDAYEIQLANIERRIDAGAVVRGHKVGLSAKAMQDMLGVSEPDYGHLLDDMFVYEGDRVPADRLCFPRVEVEVAFVLGDALPAAGCSVADVLRATAFVLPAIEIIDSRIRDWQITLPDTIADNASSAGIVLGGRRTSLSAVDVRTVGAVLRRNGAIVETGAAGAVLGNPATAVAWLANKVHTFGVTLEAGHVILPGSCTRAVDVVAGDVIRADFDTLGHVSVTFS
jgi:2-keto-4-pentenoate hydratase